MRGVNQCMFVGHLGADPVLLQTGGGTPVTNLGLVVVDRVRLKKEWVTNIEWISVVAYGVLARTCVKQLKKGSPIFVRGPLQSRDWTDKHGNRRQAIDIIAKEITFLVEGKDTSFDEDDTPPAYGPPEADAPT